MTNRQSFLKQLNENRMRRLKNTANKYAKLPENIRAAIATVAGVENIRLDELSQKDCAALKVAAKRLKNSLAAAVGLLIATQIQG